MTVSEKIAKVEWQFQKVIHDYYISRIMSLEASKLIMEKIYHNEIVKFPELKKEITLLFHEYKKSIK
jgi:hypothetical protein